MLFSRYIIVSVHPVLPAQRIEGFWEENEAQKVCQEYNRFAKFNFSYEVIKIWQKQLRRGVDTSSPLWYNIDNEKEVEIK